MGKDRPGSPLTDDCKFPMHGIVWEFNYRGTLEFMHQAEAQQEARDLKIEDGWTYFIHGWTQVIARSSTSTSPASAWLSATGSPAEEAQTMKEKILTTPRSYGRACPSCLNSWRRRATKW